MFVCHLRYRMEAILKYLWVIWHCDTSIASIKCILQYCIFSENWRGPVRLDMIFKALKCLILKRKVNVLSHGKYQVDCLPLILSCRTLLMGRYKFSNVLKNLTIVCNRWSEFSLKDKVVRLSFPVSHLSFSEKWQWLQHPEECLRHRCDHNIPIQSKVPAR